MNDTTNEIVPKILDLVALKAFILPIKLSPNTHFFAELAHNKIKGHDLAQFVQCNISSLLACFLHWFLLSLMRKVSRLIG